MTIHARGSRIAVLHVTPAEPDPGGAERFIKSLAEALKQQGAVVRIVEQISDESSVESVLESYSRFYHLNVADFDAVISTKSPAHMVRHHNHVCYLQHTMRQFYEQFASSHPSPTKAQTNLRNLVLSLDRATLSPPWVKRLFVIGRTVQRRLEHFSGLRSQVLYQGNSLAAYPGDGQNYFFLPGRLHPWKRVDLVIAAMMQARTDLPLVVAGYGQDDRRLRRLAEGDGRIQFVGYVPDDELKHLYANALAVLAVPKFEDFGLTVLEAFAAGKAVITCTDSGEPAELVADGESGFVVPPDARCIAEAIDSLSGYPQQAARMGRFGCLSLKGFDWETTSRCLMAAIMDHVDA